jgi:RimJ/RimL family protein N-acetyltransferase
MTMRDEVKVGPCLYLRRLTEEDASTLAEASHLEEETGLHEDGRIPMSVLSFEAWIRGLDASATVFAISRRGDDRCIGTASIRNIDRINGTAETGSGLLRREDRGKGLGTEAKQLLLEFAFGELGLHVLSSTVFEGNVRSARALQKQGYRFAGRLTANVLAAGGVIGDTLVFDITRHDWEHARQEARSVEPGGHDASEMTGPYDQALG